MPARDFRTEIIDREFSGATRVLMDEMADEIERLRAALKPFADLGVGSGEGYETENYRITRDAIRNARLALE